MLIAVSLILVAVLSTYNRGNVKRSEFSFADEYGIDSEECVEEDYSEEEIEEIPLSEYSWSGVCDVREIKKVSDRVRVITEDDLIVSIYGFTFSKCMIFVNPRRKTDCTSFSVAVNYADGSESSVVWEKACSTSSMFYLDMPHDCSEVTSISVRVQSVDGRIIDSGEIGGDVRQVSDNTFKVKRSGYYAWMHGGMQIGVTKCKAGEKAVTGWGVLEYIYFE